MPTFTQAKTVASGDSLNASQVASLAAAINSRLLSGVGDWVWRLAFYLHSGLVRQLRNSDGASVFPPDAEFWNIYQHVNPNDAEYPLTGPGDPEGANISNIISAFVYGGEAIGLDSEAVRLGNIPTQYADAEPMTPSRFWALGQFQRGLVDLDTGAQSWPVGDAAQAYSWVRQSLLSPHGNAWGGWLPYPVVTFGGCADPEDPNYEIKFTNLETGEVRTYPNNCPEDPARIAVSYAPFYYVLFFADGSYEVLLKSEWIEGPYTDNAQWSKTQANALGRAINHFASEFRGTVEQDAGVTTAHAFDLQRFLTTQYPLAPNVGSELGGGEIAAQYPAWQSGTSGSPGGLLSYTTAGGTTHTWREGTVCTGFLIRSSLLTAPCSIEIEEGGTVMRSLTLPSGEHEELFWLPEARRLESVRIRLTATLNASAGGGMFIEATEILAMKPQIHDYYLVTRLSSWSGDFDRIDGRGIDCESAKEILTNLYTNGCITPVEGTAGVASPGADPTLNQNAVFDAARRMTQCVRIIPRWQLTGYALEDGKSVLWFNRTAYGPAGFPDRDSFDGIGPSQEEIVDFPIKWGREYVVTDGVVAYNSHSYTEGERFTGIENVESFTGGGKCKEYDGIRATAEPFDFSNRWAMTLTSKPYHTSTTSVWKADAYGDVLTPFMNRCHLDAPEINTSKVARNHEAYGEDAIAPEAPSGFNYGRVRDSSIPGATHINKRNCGGDPTCEEENQRFYKSCRIFEPPIEIESAVMDGLELKITLKSRLHYHEDAPTSIDRDPSTWDLTVLQTDENYRTHENAVREYLIWQTTGTNASVKIGDCANNSTLPTDPDAPFGSVLPTFIFAKLIPEPYLDENDSLQSHDSPALHDTYKMAEMHLRAACEGFVDGVTTATVACDIGSVSAYDYTFENLMFQACGNRWVPLMPESVRDDNPYSFGPLPNIKFYADCHNALANAVNLLTDARIMLPSEGEHRLITGTATASINVSDACGAGIACAGLSGGTFVYGFASLNATATTPSVWNPGFSNAAGFGTALVQDTDPGVACSGSRWKIESIRNDMQVRWILTDPDSVLALPGNLGSLLDTNSVAAMLIQTTRTTSSIAYGTIGDAGGNSSGFCGSRPAGSEYAYFLDSEEVTETCGGMQNTLSAPFVASMAGIAYESAFVIATGGPASGIGPIVYEDGTAIVRIPTESYSGGS